MVKIQFFVAGWFALTHGKILMTEHDKHHTKVMVIAVILGLGIAMLIMEAVQAFS